MINLSVGVDPKIIDFVSFPSFEIDLQFGPKIDLDHIIAVLCVQIQDQCEFEKEEVQPKQFLFTRIVFGAQTSVLI